MAFCCFPWNLSNFLQIPQKIIKFAMDSIENCMDLFSTELMVFFPWFHFFSMDNWFLAMDFIFYAVENGLNKFSEPKMNGKITLSIFGMEND